MKRPFTSTSIHLNQLTKQKIAKPNRREQGPKPARHLSIEDLERQWFLLRCVDETATATWDFSCEMSSVLRPRRLQRERRTGQNRAPEIVPFALTGWRAPLQSGRPFLKLVDVDVAQRPAMEEQPTDSMTAVWVKVRFVMISFSSRWGCRSAPPRETLKLDRICSFFSSYNVHLREIGCARPWCALVYMSFWTTTQEVQTCFSNGQPPDCDQQKDVHGHATFGLLCVSRVSLPPSHVKPLHKGISHTVPPDPNETCLQNQANMASHLSRNHSSMSSASSMLCGQACLANHILQLTPLRGGIPRTARVQVSINNTLPQQFVARQRKSNTRARTSQQECAVTNPKHGQTTLERQDKTSELKGVGMAIIGPESSRGSLVLNKRRQHPETLKQEIPSKSNIKHEEHQKKNSK